MLKVVIFDFFGVLYEYQSGKFNEELLSTGKNLSKNYKLTILSNSSKNSMRSMTAGNNSFSHFSEIFTSGEIGFSKPDQRIFKYVLTNLEVKPHQVVLIDDGIQNIESASLLGMRAILHQDNQTTLQKLDKLLSSS